ncbi:MAG: hypothetical protein UW68_C0028G0002 [Candidatus Collierbacteria bacterium GW2011_GWB1_44_6]|uniref:Uncharacterized protein n=2 Tax=Candidatus Collieribacteriota TaxID=1752725 RepID=A0A0G1JMV3_9BACT|nr:MAG: hypothetical protein UV68_C0026G0028 [Candidatus Collierbacteria bacterium GW2011_GWC2_43_12]KKT72690.1 MAG: hypothetical protein UW68_C0028G0002 [Candidatus Collierbacteria bacterium GW2011_GWB1_44_6]KKT83055.1 MAG: hypothetical protein UW80_C0023G0013 [Microgenomates group bacterium GW2011_GWC1_44_9]
MNKKIILPLLSLALLIAFIVIGILQYRSQRPVISETVPLIPATPTLIITPRPDVEITPLAGIPKQTNTIEATKQVSDEISFAEKEKIYAAFPLRTEDIQTSSGLITTINIYSLSHDPASAIRLEIYGINYNDQTLSGPNAIAFKESFLEAKRQIDSRGAILKNLQIIFGNRQYIQDTATYWVTTMNLLN